jgi:hypothetical protein
VAKSGGFENGPDWNSETCMNGCHTSGMQRASVHLTPLALTSRGCRSARLLPLCTSDDAERDERHVLLLDRRIVFLQELGQDAGVVLVRQPPAR